MIFKYSPFIRTNGFIEFFYKNGYNVSSIIIERIRDFKKFDELSYIADELRTDTDIFYVSLEFPEPEKDQHIWVIKIYMDNKFYTSCQMTQLRWEDQLNAN